MSETATLAIRASDVTGQRASRVGGVSVDSTVGELMDRLLAGLSLVRRNTRGEPLTYKARLEREQRHLYDSERVGDALQEDDHITLAPFIQAG